MRNMRHNTQKKHYIAALCLVLAALSLVLIAASVAKYSSTVRGKTHSVIPESFRFECTPYANGHRYIVTEATESIAFDVDSEQAEYTVTCDNGATVTQNGNKVTLTNLGEVGTIHTVTVSTVAPYAKTISFSFQVVASSVESYYKIVNKDGWVELTLYIGSAVPSNVTINYGTLAPDNLNPLMTTWRTEATSAILNSAQLTPHSQYTLIFFGTSNMIDVASEALTNNTTINLIVSAQAQTTAKNGAPASQ